MSAGAPQCRTVTVHTFRGDRTSAFKQYIFGALDDQRNGRGFGPSRIACLLFSGHTGVSIDSDPRIYGFNPDGGNDPLWLVMQNLRSRLAYPGKVSDDTAVFTAAQQHGLRVLTVDVLLPQPSFTDFTKLLAAERNQSRFTYGFPDGDGDCNCTTWLERLGLPLLTGGIVEFVAVMGVAAQTRRRFGFCT
jgi:hypothetical protein